jgi:DNA-binding CsgD family transcriptional regulator
VLSGQMQRAAEASELLTDIAGQLGPEITPIANLLAGSIQAMRGAGDDARDALDRCRPAFDIPDPPTELLQQLVYFATEYSIVNALEDAHVMFDRAINLARQRGAIGLLPFALAMSATNEYRMGNWVMARAQAAEAETLANDTGRTTDRPNAIMAKAMVDAARGREQAREDALTVIREAADMGAGFIEAQGFSILGLLELSIGRPDAAIEPLERCRRLSTDFGLFELGHLQWAAELVEAEIRTGQSAGAATVLETMRATAHPHATRLNQALLARCEGLLAAEDRWEEHFCHALTLHTGPDIRPFEVARTELCFGERLRRNRRRRDAREHLERAWQLFSDLGAQTWANRASIEIQATGKPAPRTSPHPTDLLTPQEYQVAITVASGATNRETANALFLSQKTVEFHLSSTYRRLGIRSRSELAKKLAERRET